MPFTKWRDQVAGFSLHGVPALLSGIFLIGGSVFWVLSFILFPRHPGQWGILSDPETFWPALGVWAIISLVVGKFLYSVLANTSAQNRAFYSACTPFVATVEAVRNDYRNRSARNHRDEADCRVPSETRPKLTLSFDWHYGPQVNIGDTFLLLFLPATSEWRVANPKGFNFARAVGRDDIISLYQSTSGARLAEAHIEIVKSTFA